MFAQYCMYSAVISETMSQQTEIDQRCEASKYIPLP